MEIWKDRPELERWKETDWVRKAGKLMMWTDTEIEVGGLEMGNRVTETDKKRR